MVVGIPRSLFYYYFFPYWSCVLEELKIPYVVSPPTNQEILGAGLQAAVDEICLPVKIHLGHLAYLAESCDRILSPGYGRWGRRSHFCPKLMGLPDISRSKFVKTLPLWHDLDDTGRPVTDGWPAALAALAIDVSRRGLERIRLKAWERQREFYRLCEDGYTPPEILARFSKAEAPAEPGRGSIRIAVLGHPYLVYDEAASHGLLTMLRQAGALIHTEETVPSWAKQLLWPSQKKRVFWRIGQGILSAALYYTRHKRMDGIIFLSACLCGPDALVGELLERNLAREPAAPPLLKLTVDEHSGRTGLETRVEAFLDLIDWRRHGKT